MIGLISFGVIIIGLCIYFIFVYRPRRMADNDRGKGQKKGQLGRILLKKKVIAIGGTPGKRRTRANVDVKDKLYYLQDELGKQFSLRKKDYRPKADATCPMRNHPREEFACPSSVVGKCGLTCTQKDELKGGQPEQIKVWAGAKKVTPVATGKPKKKGKGKGNGRTPIRRRAPRPKRVRKEKEVSNNENRPDEGGNEVVHAVKTGQELDEKEIEKSAINI